MGQAVGAEQNDSHAGHQAMGQRARIGQGFELLTLLSVQLQRGQGSSQVHRHLHSPQKMPKGKSWRNTSISYLRDTTLAGESLCANRALALAASSSRFLGDEFVLSECRSRVEASAISSTAASNAASLAFDGLLKPLIFLTN